jgi:sugar phosphate isomerase/epimerase
MIGDPGLFLTTLPATISLMIRLAFSTNAFKKNSLEEAVEAIALVGYAGVELMADRPHAYPGDMPGDRRRRIRELVDRGGWSRW